MTNGSQLKQHPLRFGILFALFLIAVAYHVLADWVPAYKERRLSLLQSQIDEAVQKRCGADDAVCLQKRVDDVVAAQNRVLLESPLTALRDDPDYIAALWHRDGSFCFILNIPWRDVPEHELDAWLERFGSKRFSNLSPVFYYAKKIYEERYHGTNSDRARIAAVGQIRQHQFPLSPAWQRYNTSGYILEAAHPVSRPRIPETVAAIVLPEYLRHAEYFSGTNFLRLLKRARGIQGTAPTP